MTTTGPAPDAAPTWRDLPAAPPYGPVTPPRTPNIAARFAAPDVEEVSTFSPGQIALAVGSTLLLVAIGIGAALLLLDGDDDVVAEATPQASIEPAIPEEDPAPTVAPDPPRGELEPQQPPNGAPPDADPPPVAPPPEAPPPGAQVPDVPAPGEPGPTPDAIPQPQATDEGIDLPRLFVLRTLPSGMAETSTTVRQTTRDDEVVQEQTTLLDATDSTGGAGEVTVRASRADDAAARFDALVDEDAEELSVRGLPAYLVEDGRLVWLSPGAVETLLEIIAPAGVRTDQLLTLGNGLELVR